MLYLRAIASGVFIWSCVSLSFYALKHIPYIKDSFSTQAFIVMIGISVYAFLGACFYYKKGYKTNGIIVGIILSGTALLMDILITVPFVEIPKGRNYQGFFSNPVLWILVLITVFTVYFYWKKHIKIH